MVEASAIGGDSGWTDEMSSYQPSYFLLRRRRTLVCFLGLFEGKHSNSVATGITVEVSCWTNA